MENAIRFTLNGTPREVSGVSPSTTVLDWLRAERLTGTKEGCAEGDCGACTVVLDQGIKKTPRFQAVNSCLMLVPQLDGLDVGTIEGVSQNGELHEVQKLLVETDGTQCGFCTPGFVMSMYAFAQDGEPRDDAHIHEALAGNLCRCTGYRAIVDACKKISMPAREPDIFIPSRDYGTQYYEYERQLIIMPQDLNGLLEERASHQDAIILAGGTDLGIRASKDREQFPKVILATTVFGLDDVKEKDGFVEIGATATYTDALPLIDKHFPSFGGLIRRIGSRQIRNLGTIAGNLVNASPIGDTPPCLIALGADVVIASKRGERILAVEEFITGYRKTALVADEIVTAVRIPYLARGARFETYKISKRFDQDISSTIGAFYTRGDEVRVAFGGMADRAKRASNIEILLRRKSPSLAEIEAAMAKDFTPLTDHRATKEYRLRGASGLVQRCLLEADTAKPTRVEAL
jgi:xanthine dehydrogenase small subunit